MNTKIIHSKRLMGFLFYLGFNYKAIKHKNSNTREVFMFEYSDVEEQKFNEAIAFYSTHKRTV